MSTVRIIGLRQVRVFRHPYPARGVRYFSADNLERSSKLQKTDFEYCVDLVQNRDRESYICGLLMPQTSRRSYFAVRALNVELASIKDGSINRQAANENEHLDEQPVAGASVALRIRFQWWRDAIGQIYGDDVVAMRAGNKSDENFLASMATSCWNNPVVRVLNHAVEESSLTRRFLERLLEAREDDLDVTLFNTMEDAIAYAESTFSTLLYLSLETTNVRQDNCDDVAYHAGIGIGLATAIRGARFRMARGECTIPKELLPEQFPYQKLSAQNPKSELTEEEHQQIKDAVMEMAMAASAHLAEARDRQGDLPSRARPCLLPVVPALHYLSRLETAEYDIFNDGLLEPEQLKVLLLLGRTWMTGIF